MPAPSDYSCAACGSSEFVHAPNASFELWQGGERQSAQEESARVLEMLARRGRKPRSHD